MDKFTSRQIIVSVFIGALSLCSLSLVWDNHVLSKKNEQALEDSRTIQKILEKFIAKYQVLLGETSSTEKEKQAIGKTVGSLKKQIETLTFRIKQLETKSDSVKDEKNYLEEMLINKTKQIEILKNQKSASVAVGDESAPDQIRTTVQEKEVELRKLSEQNKLLQEKLDRLFRTTNEKINEINIAKIALSETVLTAQKKIENEWNTVNLGAITTSPLISAMPSYQNRIEETSVPHEPKTQGHVVAINSEHGFVVIDIGKADNLPSDATLEVKKDGATIATLSVLETRDAMTACNIQNVQEGQQIQINDLVTILR